MPLVPFTSITSSVSSVSSSRNEDDDAIRTTGDDADESGGAHHPMTTIATDTIRARRLLKDASFSIAVFSPRHASIHSFIRRMDLDARQKCKKQHPTFNAMHVRRDPPAR